MNAFDYDLICIGSGPAGQRAAVQAAKLGKRVAVIERQRWVGGVCVDYGTIPSKTFREAVLTYTGYGSRFLSHQGKSVGQIVTSEKLQKEVREVVRNEADIVERQLQRNNIDLKRGVASMEGLHTVRISSESGSAVLSGDRILIATGSQPALYPDPDHDRSIIVTSDDMPFLKFIPSTMTVIGAGVIGIEYASIFAALGIEVTIIHRRRRLLEFLDREIVDELVRQMEKMKVVFRLEESVESIETKKGSARRGVVKLQSGEEIPGDIILYSVGRIGATSELKLEKAGLEADSKGRLKVNKFFQTDIPHIYAAGDVIGFPSLAATSSEQGRLASRHAFIGDTGGMAEHFPLGIYSIPEISMVGKPEHELDVEEIPYVTGIARYRELARGQILGDDSGLLKMLFSRKTKQLLGVHAIGTGATELIHIGQAVLRLGGGLDYFLHTVFNYPTLAEGYKVAALDAANKLGL
ncbi:MAG: Si-specific NAD(P)(+) transhydrogenase [Acidobacteria bacterium]|nr:Si-specific NAD(P)(+) transhydrogenase [Acidobacteriota bacterium]